MEDAVATKATSALNAGLGVVDRRLKELDIKWGIDYGILRDAFDDLKDECDRYRKALNRIYQSFENGEKHTVILAEIAAEALGIATEPPSY